MIRCVALLLVLAAGLAQAEPTLLVCYPNAPGSTENAKPIMKQLGEHLQGKAVYFNNLEAAEGWIQANGEPTCAIVSLGVYLRWREPRGLELIARSERHGETAEQFFLLVANDSPATDLASFAKQTPTVWSAHLDNRAFAERVVFAKRLSVGDEATRLVSTAQPLRALRRLKAGREFEGHPVDGVVLDSWAWGELQQLASFKGKLRVLFESAPLPTPQVVSFANSDPKQVALLRERLLAMGATPKSKKLLESLQLTAFRAAEPEAIKPVWQAYEAAQ